MPYPIRTFIAVHVRATRPLRQVIDRFRGLGRALKPVNDEALHVTLKFLGDTDPALVPRIHEEVVAATAGQGAFEMWVAGVGCFPNTDRPRVVWAGLQGAEALVTIAAELERRLEPLGFAPEGRPFRPHLTLARVRDGARPPRELADLLAEHAEAEFGTARVESVVLYQSELRPQGPVYTALATAELSS